jgi:hypothetical protein
MFPAAWRMVRVRSILFHCISDPGSAHTRPCTLMLLRDRILAPGCPSIGLASRMRMKAPGFGAHQDGAGESCTDAERLAR